MFTKHFFYRFIFPHSFRSTKNLDNTPITKRVLSTGRYEKLSEEVRGLLLQKGVFPYKWLDSLERFKETELPAPRTAFDSHLTGDKISDEDYNRAQKVFRECKNFGDYHNSYLDTDVALLADVFETFRSLMMDVHGLDPAHYLTTPGMAWDAMLKLTGVKLELMTEMSKQLFVEKGLRGGICQVSHRAIKANKPMAETTGGPKYDPTKKRTRLTYVDVNNLYGCAMVDNIPYGGFKWVEPAVDVVDDIKRLNGRGVDDARGTYYEVDL